ncbi:2-hydroxymuconate tautomerase family protein [Saccharopolyspora phatthalungensis]|uniref:Tautomerase n=1 Tax=Saccharopolyspora phatthalungensis TaxID=664693 RepID=A0A840QB15_9PSEU|nr:2-hydroxymuconate tautomerase family protein [Saccharopolyspora phatthalungensis]MBB5156971.1 4-oxalocrotonate tautomerase [Saccharopolyspora phatthalungensis]
MPLIQVSIVKGRSDEQLRALGAALTAATVDAIGARPESIRVVVQECEAEHWFVAGESLAERRASGHS